MDTGVAISDEKIEICIELLDDHVKQVGLDDEIFVGKLLVMDDEDCRQAAKMHVKEGAGHNLSLHPLKMGPHFVAIAIFRSNDIRKGLKGRPAVIVMDSESSNANRRTYEKLKETFLVQDGECQFGLPILSTVTDRRSQQLQNDCGVHTIIKIASFISRYHSKELFVSSGCKYTEASCQLELPASIKTNTQYCVMARQFVQNAADTGTISIDDNVVKAFKVNVGLPVLDEGGEGSADKKKPKKKGNGRFNRRK